jgi:hypothetical protein
LEQTSSFGGVPGQNQQHDFFSLPLGGMIGNGSRSGCGGFFGSFRAAQNNKRGQDVLALRRADVSTARSPISWNKFFTLVALFADVSMCRMPFSSAYWCAS